ncbi:MAG TPA: hypothetical protein VGS59_06080, partial [Candidatus Acidoferrales bacterium]|nr:hypothetical protein [Candidatus Acidoferrales bacterium]
MDVALIVTVGCAGAGAGAGVGAGGGTCFFLQAPANTRNENALNRTRSLRTVLLCIENPPLRALGCASGTEQGLDLCKQLLIKATAPRATAKKSQQIISVTNSVIHFGPR